MRLCPCGRAVREEARCPRCGERRREAGHLEAAPSGRRPPPPSRAPSLGLRAGLLLAAALLPLFASHLVRHESVRTRLRRTLERAPPGTLARLDALPAPSRKSVLACLPDGRIDGALLAVDSRAHWGMAAVTALAAGAVLLRLFAARGADLVRAGQVALFTGVVGIGALGLAQRLCFWAHGVQTDGLLGALLELIGGVASAYLATDDGERGFLGHLVGYLFSVGLLEELCKIAPLVLLARGPEVATDRRTWLVYGLASGLGFGVAEGLHYAEWRYNGLATAGTYVVRFASCVAIHGVLCASVAVSLQRRLAWLSDASWLSRGPWLALGVALAWPMLAHALYDTLLDHRQPIVALGVAFAACVWLAWQVERPVRAARP